MSEWIGVEALALELGVPVRTVYAWRTAGTGPRGHKIGKHVRFRREDVEQWLTSRADPEPAA
jgi:excisionase family DNA binding protein